MHNEERNQIRTKDLVSIVIACFNQAHFLSKAIESALNQSHKNIEVIVVDDGSTDNTKYIANSYKDIKYIFQENAGLSAARNNGILNSTGNYILCLDSDDWLLPEGVHTNLKYFNNDQKLGFVSGNFISFFDSTQEQRLMVRAIKQKPYAELLLYNHVRMHAAVLFPKWIFNLFKYDPSLKSSEDWDLYLQITRKYSIIQHEEPIAVYRRYGSSMSRNNIIMLETGLKVLNKQKFHLNTIEEKQNYINGKKTLIKKFTRRIFKKVLNDEEGNENHLGFLFKYNKILFLKSAIFLIKKKFKRKSREK